MQNTNQQTTTTDALFVASNGTVYRILEDCMVINQMSSVEISYPAFLRMSNKDLHVGVDTLLSPNAISAGEGYTSRNISVVQIPNVGMAWATRVSTTLPIKIAQKNNIQDRNIGKDFLFFWHPIKSLSAYLTVAEQTRIDGRARFLSHCNPTPKVIFSDWNMVLPQASTPVDISTLTASQRLFLACINPMVHLSLSRYKIDEYCSRRASEDTFLHTNAPIQIKYAGLKRLRRKEEDSASFKRSTRQRHVTYNEMQGKQQQHKANTNHENSNNKMHSSIRYFKELLCGRLCEDASGSGSVHNHDLADATLQNTTWDMYVPDDVQSCIIDSVVHQALNTMDDFDGIRAICNSRLVCKAFLEKTNQRLHVVLVEAHHNAKRFCEPILSVEQVDKLLFNRTWWDNCRLPYTSLLTYQSDKPSKAVTTLSKIVKNNAHNPYPTCNVVPSLDIHNDKRTANMQRILHNVNNLALLNPSFLIF